MEPKGGFFLCYTESMNIKENKDVWGDINARAGIAFGLAMIVLLLTYIAFFK